MKTIKLDPATTLQGQIRILEERNAYWRGMLHGALCTVGALLALRFFTWLI